MAAISALWLAGTASADEWVTPFVWFPVTQRQWQANTLGSGRIVSLRTEGGALVWRVDFLSQSGRFFRRKNGAIQIHALDSCDEIHIYTEVPDNTQREARFDRLDRDSRIVDPPTRAELGDLAGRWRAFVARGPLRPPQPGSYDLESCEAIRSRCIDLDTRTRMGAGFGLPPGGYSVAGPPRFAACEQADRAVNHCVEAIPADEARYVEAVARYEQRMRCVGLAIVTRTVDGHSIGLEVISIADDEQWGSADVGLAERIDASAWAYAPLTVVADVPVMALCTVANASFYLLGAIYVFAH